MPLTNQLRELTENLSQIQAEFYARSLAKVVTPKTPSIEQSQAIVEVMVAAAALLGRLAPRLRTRDICAVAIASKPVTFRRRIKHLASAVQAGDWQNALEQCLEIMNGAGVPCETAVRSGEEADERSTHAGKSEGSFSHNGAPGLESRDARVIRSTVEGTQEMVEALLLTVQWQPLEDSMAKSLLTVTNDGLSLFDHADPVTKIIIVRSALMAIGAAWCASSARLGENVPCYGTVADVDDNESDDESEPRGATPRIDLIDRLSVAYANEFSKIQTIVNQVIQAMNKRDYGAVNAAARAIFRTEAPHG